MLPNKFCKLFKITKTILKSSLCHVLEYTPSTLCTMGKRIHKNKKIVLGGKKNKVNTTTLSRIVMRKRIEEVDRIGKTIKYL